MLRKAGEVVHHSRSDVEGYARNARDILQALSLDPANHDVTMAALVQLLGAKQIEIEKVDALGILGR